MKTFLRAVRAASAAGFLWCSANGATASPESLGGNGEWTDTVSWPSIVATSWLEADDDIRVLSDVRSGSDAMIAAQAGDGDVYPVSLLHTPGPAYNVSVGANFMRRSRPESSAIVTPPTGTPGVVVNGSDFAFDWCAGPDLTVSQRMQNGWIWEGRYFDNRSADAEITIPNITNFRIAGINVTIGGGGPIDSFYTTDLNSSELNLHKQLTPGCTFLTGFRWIELHDALRVNLVGPPIFANWDENNHLYGGQIGTNMAFTNPYNPFQFTGTLKAGAYANDADNQFTAPIGFFSGGDTDTALAFVGEVNFSGAYYLTRNLALRGGYQVLWIDNVAIASDAAVNTTQLIGSANSPVSLGRLWYNGVTFGVDYVW